MAYPKLNPPDSALPPRVSRPGAETISLTARRLARPKSQAKPHISGADQAALSRIAERFAPGARRRARRPIRRGTSGRNEVSTEGHAEGRVIRPAGSSVTHPCFIVGGANAHRGAHCGCAAPELGARGHVMARRDQDAVVHRRSRRRRAIAGSQSVTCRNHAGAGTGSVERRPPKLERSLSPRLTRSMQKPAAKYRLPWHSTTQVHYLPAASSPSPGCRTAQPCRRGVPMARRNGI